MSAPLISIIIRTCQRPEVLKCALNSVRAQSYKNVQAVIVEDGENTAGELLSREYSDLNYIYESTGEKVGRSKAGNRAMELATGEYFNFLDDDDAFFPEHVEKLIKHLREYNCLAAYSVAEERQIVIKSREPYSYSVKQKSIRFRQPFNRLLLCTNNYIPIQSIMFHRSLYEELGGFDVTLDNLEDWDLWVRYATKTDYIFVDDVTSYYHVPYVSREKRKRSDELRDYLPPVYKKFETYSLNMKVSDINKEMQYIIREYKNKGLLRYVRMFMRAVLFGEK